MRPSTGYVRRTACGWTARITTTDPATRKRVNLTKSFATRTDASDWLDAQRRKLRGGGMAGRGMTFRDLCGYYLIHHATEPTWKEGRIISGMRSWDDAQQRAEILVEYLGDKKLASIRYDDLKAVREKLFRRELKRGGGTLSIATVNRIMSVGRRMFKIAIRQEWIDQSPFDRGEPLVKTGDEAGRERILTSDEEGRLLAACEKIVIHGNGGKRKRSRHLRPILITALDTGMRLGEILNLTWKDVDLKAGVIRIPMGITKTLRSRPVGITPRLRLELEAIAATEPKANDRVFGIQRNVQSSWRAVRKDARLEDVRFHDLRHTAITRMIAAGVPLAQAGKIAGHQTPATTARYHNPDAEMAKKAARMLSRKKRAGKRLPVN